MADNVTANAGTGGAVFATDDDGTAHHPYTKIEFGADNTQTKVAAASGQGLPVQGEAAENAAVTGNPVQVGGRYDATPRTLGDGDVGGIALDADGAVHIADGGNTITVDGTVDLGATDNAVLDQIEVNTSYGDQTGGGTEASALRVTIANNSTGVVSVDDNGGALTVDGDVAHDAADSGAPVKMGAKAYSFDGTAPQTAVAEADRVNLIATPEGRLMIETAHPRYFNAHADYASAQTNATVQAAPGVGLKLYITDVIISNGATAGNVTLLDGSGGSVLLEVYPAINGGITHSFRTPLVLTANTLLAITSTTVTTHSVTVSGYIAA